MQDHSHSILTRKRYRMLIWVIIASMVGYFLLSIWGGWEQVIQEFLEVGFIPILILLTLSFCNYIFRFLRWQSYLYALSFEVPWAKSFQIYLSGFALTTTPGKAGEALRSIFLKEWGIPVRKSIGVLLAERFSDLIAISLLTLLGLGLYQNLHWVVFPLLVCIFLILYLVQRPTILKKIERFFLRWFPAKISSFLTIILDMIISFRACFSFKNLVMGVGLGVIAWGLEGLAFAYLLYTLGAEINILTAIFIFSFSQLVGAITFMPGGLGTTEVSLWQLLLFFGAQEPIAATATIVIRFTTLWFAVVLGLIALPKEQVSTT